MDRNSKYYYSHWLNKAERFICDQLLKGLEEFKTSVFVVGVGCTNKTIKKIIRVIDLDFPEIFYLDTSQFFLTCTGVSATVEFRYLYSRRDIENTWSGVKMIASDISRRFKGNCDAIQKERIIHDYLAANVTYYTGDNINADHCNIVGALLNGAAVCEGYAKAFKYLCELNDILCLVVSGDAVDHRYGGRERHAWNIVRVYSNGCCHVDVTWDCVYNQKAADFYFNVQDSEISIDHFWDRDKVPVCSGGKVPELCTGTAEFENIICRALKNNCSEVSFRVNKDFSSADEILNMAIKILERHREFAVKNVSAEYLPGRRQVNLFFVR